jgi:hypothetical protein
MIGATELLDIRMAADSASVRLRVRDAAGRITLLSLQTCWLNDMPNVVPSRSRDGRVHAVESWSVERGEAGDALVLTLRTAEGQAVSFAMKPWQVEGIATLAPQGRSGHRHGTTIH